jgi:hypothetical protein
MDRSAPRATPELLHALEASLQDLLQQVQPTPVPERTRGRPPILAASVLWAGLLVCVLRGFTAQRSLWQLVRLRGLWQFPRVKLTSQAVYQRLARTSPAPLLQLFEQITTLLRERYATQRDVPYAAFATDIFALDHCRLDAVLRKLKLLREVPRSDPRLLPGQLASLFDLRRQMWHRVEFWEDAQRNEKFNVTHWLTLLAPGTLLLFDLGFFAFHWFDALTTHGVYFVAKLRKKTSLRVHHTLYNGPAGPVHLREQLVYLGAYRADRAAHPVRLIEIFMPAGVTYRYITNVLDPQLLPAAHIVALYPRRWDIEQAFNLLKTYLNLFLLWSAHPNVVLLQVFATLIIAQVVLALRTEIAQQAGAALREVSLPLMLRWLPEIADQGEDPVRVLAERGRETGIIRPFRGKEHLLPSVQVSDYDFPPARPPPREARYAGKQGDGRGTPAGPERKKCWKKKHGWGLRARRPRCA